MNLLHMKHAIEVAKAGSLSKASEVLLIAAPNISRSIKELENDLGITIFDRTQNGMKLTPEGEEFINFATERIEECLGCNKLTPAVLVGAGKMGRALLHFNEFEKYGVKIVAAFDSNEETINFGGKAKILPMARFEQFCKEGQIRLGIITVGEGSAQEVCDQMVKGGITAIWNFAPCKLNVPSGVLLQNENLALSLAHLNNQLCN